MPAARRTLLAIALCLAVIFGLPACRGETGDLATPASTPRVTTTAPNQAPQGAVAATPGRAAPTPQQPTLMPTVPHTEPAPTPEPTATQAPAPSPVTFWWVRRPVQVPTPTPVPAAPPAATPVPERFPTRTPTPTMDRFPTATPFPVGTPTPTQAPAPTPTLGPGEFPTPTPAPGRPPEQTTVLSNRPYSNQVPTYIMTALWTDAAPPYHWEGRAQEFLEQLAYHDAESALRILNFPWVQDGVTGQESTGISRLASILQEHNDFGRAVLDQWWVADGLTGPESGAVSELRSISNNDISFAWSVIDQPFLDPPFRLRDELALGSLNGLTEDLPGRPPGSVLRSRLESGPWFNDGIDDSEAVLLYAITRSPRDFALALLERNYMASATVELPLAGPVEFTVVRHTPFPDDDYVVATMEQGLRNAEQFMGSPFPLTDVIMVLTEPEIWNVGAGRGFFEVSGGDEGSALKGFFATTNWEDGPHKGSIYHELAHYYYFRGPGWVVEGMANYVESLALSAYGDRDLESWRQRLVNSERCDRENIQQHVVDRGDRDCDYDLGELFMFAMVDAIGQDAVAAALRQLTSLSRRFVYLDEDTIFHAFSSNVPLGREDAFKAAYRHYHGYPLVDQQTEDAVDRAPLVALYHAAGGPGWEDSYNWTTTAPLGAWHGVTTEPGGRVWLIDLDNNNLSGPVPPEIGNLSDLRTLALQVNSLTGTLPASLGNLDRLRNLWLGGNGLTGEIPPEIGDMQEIDTIWLWDNNLTGNIPAELGNLPNLRFFLLQNNQLTGQIPEELANIPTLEILRLKGNQFTGCIPTALYSISAHDLDELSLPRCAE